MYASRNEYPSFKAYWPYYVSQHRNKLNRNLHFLGTTGALAFLYLGIAASPWMLLAAPFTGYGFAWLGHFFLERNRPATFQYPLYSLMGDMQMFAYMCAGRMDREVRRLAVLSEGKITPTP